MMKTNGLVLLFVDLLLVEQLLLSKLEENFPMNMYLNPSKKKLKEQFELFVSTNCFVIILQIRIGMLLNFFVAFIIA